MTLLALAGLALPELTKRLDVRLGLMEREGLPVVWARPLLAKTGCERDGASVGAAG